MSERSEYELDDPRTEAEWADAGLSHPLARDPEEKSALDPKPIPKRSHRGLQNIRVLEDELLVETFEIISDTMAFREIDPQNPVTPDAWVKELGPEEAEKKLRVATAGWMSAKDAPVAIKVAAQTLAGILKARASENRPVVKLNIQRCQMVIPQLREDPVKVIESDE